MNVLVTGSQGYIGHHLIKKLLERKYKVTGVDNQTRFLFHMSGVRRFQLSITNPELSRALNGVEAIIHLADRSDWTPNPRHPVHLTQHNVLGTANLLSLANSFGIDRVIYTSSADVYGNLVDATETDPCVPVTFYGASKLAAEAVCRGFYQRGMDVSILRLFNVWGKIGSRSAVNQFTYGNHAVYGDGTQTRDFIYIDDVVEAIVLALEFWDPGVYNVGTGEETTISGLWGLFHDEEPEYRPLYEYRQAGTDQVQRISSNQEYTHRVTGWKPSIYLSNLNRNSVKELCKCE